MSKAITVAVTGLNAVDSPGPGLSVIRSLLESTRYSVKIIGLAYESMEPGIYMKELVAKTYHIPYPSSGSQNLLERLRYIHDRETIDVLIPNFDAELLSFIKLETQLSHLGIAMCLPNEKQFESRQKANLVQFGYDYGVNIPFSIPLYSVKDIVKTMTSFSFPVLVKGQYYEAFIAHSLEETIVHFKTIQKKWGLPVIVQEFIKGQEYNVVALGDGTGEMIGAVAMKKNFVTDKGKAWAGVSIDEPGLMALARHIIRGTRWRGCMEIELVKANDGRYFVIEINPRIPAWIYLATGAQQNLPEALVALALGDPVKPYSSYQFGKMFIRYSYDMIVNMEDYQTMLCQGEL